MRLCFSHFSHEQAYFSLHATQILAYEPLKGTATLMISMFYQQELYKP